MTYAKPTDSNAALISAHTAARDAVNSFSTIDAATKTPEFLAAVAQLTKAQNALYDFQVKFALGTTVVRIPETK